MDHFIFYGHIAPLFRNSLTQSHAIIIVAFTAVFVYTMGGKEKCTVLPYTIDEITRRVAPVAKKYELAAVYLFGSYARGEATAASDVDLLVDLTGSVIRGLNFAALYMDLEAALETQIDLLTVSCLDQPTDRSAELEFNETVLRERRKIYAAA